MLSTSESYTNYSSTDSLWYRKYPSHWSHLRIKDVLASQTSFKVPRDLCDDDEMDFVPMACVDPEKGVITGFQKGKLSDFRLGYSRFKNHDVIFAKITPCMENGNCAIVRGLKHGIGFGSSEFLVYTLSRKVMPEYFHYFLHNANFRKNAELFMKGSAGQKRISSHYMESHFFALPSLHEQRAIAACLDRETDKIDRKVGILEKKARLYKELKQSLINETVTRGLHKSASLRHSGVDWIGEIPEHWRVRRVVDVAEQRKEKNTGLRNKNLLSLSYGKIKRRDFNTAHGLLPASFETYQIVAPGNIILRLTDLQNDWKSLRVGLVKETGIITSAYLNLAFFKGYHPSYFYYLLHSFDLVKVFYWQGGGLRQSMKFDDIKILPVICPPTVEEQQAIVDYLDEKTAKIDQIAEAIEEQIKLLKELRKTLINDVVTGKIRVTETEKVAS